MNKVLDTIKVTAQYDHNRPSQIIATILARLPESGVTLHTLGDGPVIKMLFEHEVAWAAIERCARKGRLRVYLDGTALMLGTAQQIKGYQEWHAKSKAA